MSQGFMTWGVPAVVLAMGAFVFAVAWIGSRSFDHRYGRKPGTPAE
jgi:hypothetical protein